MDSQPTPPRLYFLDWLRLLAFGLLIPYHVGMVYVRWPFHLKSPDAATSGPWVEPWMLLSNPWRMSLLFVVSGAATMLMLRQHGVADGAPVPAGWLRQRLGRLGRPLLFGVLVLVPPQAYVEVLHRHGYTGGYADFLRLYFTGYHGFCDAPGRCLILPTWNHLWFLPYLAAYTLLLWLGLKAWPMAPARLHAAALRWLRGPVLLLGPVAWLWAARRAQALWWPETHALVDDWALHAQYAPLFVGGAVLAAGPGLWPRLQAARWWALGLALAAWGGLLWGLPPPWRSLAVAVQQCGAIVAALGFAHRHLNVDHRWRQRLTGWVFPLYVLHQTVILLLAHALVGRGLPLCAEAALLLAGSVAGTLVLVAAVERVPALWRWVGMTGPGRTG